ncbi:MAG: hypothetical protein Q4F81_03955 [Eubacteriales bacterium]|nr:hypothetical protein [Eubacteriales bacterium]
MYEQTTLLTAGLDEITGTTDHSGTQPQEQTPQPPVVRYYEINEETARRANDMNSMRDYKPGSATAEYRAAVDKAAALVRRCKAATSPYYHDKLDALLDRYARRLAAYYNDYYRNEAACPSILISGGSNFPVNKKNKQNARRDTLFQEYKDIQGILDKIKSVGTGPVDLADPHARDMLAEQLQQLQSKLDTGKAMNAYYRKHKTMKGFPELSDEAAAKMDESISGSYSWAQKPMPDYELTSLRGKIKRVQARLAELDSRAAQQSQPAERTKFDGGEIVRNLEADRLQILFDEKPDEATRSALKQNGFRWSPRYNAWQRQLTRNAETAARRALGLN